MRAPLGSARFTWNEPQRPLGGNADPARIAVRALALLSEQLERRSTLGPSGRDKAQLAQVAGGPPLDPRLGRFGHKQQAADS